MKLRELVDELEKILSGNESVGVMLRKPGHMDFVHCQVTLTYNSERRNGTTIFDQVPIVLIEEADRE